MAGVDPISLAVIGAGVGAIANKDDPIKGAILGGAAGFTGGTALGAGAAGGAAGAGAAGAGAAGSAAVPAGTQLYASTVPGLASAAPGSQAAMLAAQTGSMGLPGLAGTASSATYAGAGGPLAGGFWNAANQAMLPGTAGSNQALQAARIMNQPSGGTRTNVSPPPIRQGKAPTMVDPIQGLLASQMQRRRRQPMSLLG